MIKIERVLVPIDFSEFSKMALSYGCEIARRFDAEVHLLHVVQDTYPMIPEAGALLPSAQDYFSELTRSAERDLQTLPSQEDLTGLRVKRCVTSGVPFLEIIRYAREIEADLIVIGTHGRTGLTHVLMGSVAELVVRKAPCPVLTTRLKGHQFVMP